MTFGLSCGNIGRVAVLVSLVRISGAMRAVPEG